MAQAVLTQRYEPLVAETLDRSERDRFWLVETKRNELRIDVALHSSERQDIKDALTLLNHVDEFIPLSEHNSLTADHKMS